MPVIQFNPWRFGSENEMLKGFFVEVAEGLDSPLLTKGEKLAEQIREKLGWMETGLKEATKSLPGNEILESGVSRWLFPAIEKLRARVRAKLTENKKRVVVLVDDPDRLAACRT